MAYSAPQPAKTWTRIFLFRHEILLGELTAEILDPSGTDALFSPTSAFDDLHSRFDQAAACDSYESGWLRFLAPLHLSLVFPDGSRTGDFVLRLKGERARVSWTEEPSRESGE